MTKSTTESSKNSQGESTALSEASTCDTSKGRPGQTRWGIFTKWQWRNMPKVAGRSIDLDLVKELDSVSSGASHRIGTMQFTAVSNVPRIFFPLTRGVYMCLYIS